MILFYLLTIGCESPELSTKEKSLQKDFIEKATEDEFDFLDDVESEDLDRLIQERDENDEEDTLVDIIATWDYEDTVSHFVETLDKASSKEEDKKRAIFMECLEKAFLYKSVNLIKSILDKVDEISDDEFKLLLDNCLRVEKGRQKIHFDYRTVEADIYESLQLLFNKDKNKKKKDLVSDEIVEKILYLEYWDSDTKKGFLDMIIEYKGEEYLKEKWIDSDKLAELIVEKRLVILARNLLNIQKSSKINVDKVLQNEKLARYLTRIGLKKQIKISVV